MLKKKRKVSKGYRLLEERVKDLEEEVARLKNVKPPTKKLKPFFPDTTHQ